METRRHEEEKENEDRWLLTYADLITLLMAFFVIMYAMSKVDVAKFQQLIVTLSAAFHTPRSSAVSPPTLQGQTGREHTTMLREQPTESAEEREKQRRETETLRDEFLELIKLEGLENAVSVSISPSGREVIVRLQDSLLFDLGSAHLTPEAQALIDKMAAIIAKAGRYVRVEGHTDNVPIHTAQFESNWQLSTARAANVIQYLIEKFGLPPETLSASGYSEYRPVESNDTPEGRAKNRRVEFVILPEQAG